MERKPRDLLDPASIESRAAYIHANQAGPPQWGNPKKIAMKTHFEVHLREDIRLDLAERMKFALSDLRAREHVFCWQEDPSKIQQGRKSVKWLKVEIIAVKGSMAVVNAHRTSGKHKQAVETVGHWIWKNFRTRVSEWERLCCGSHVKVK